MSVLVSERSIPRSIIVDQTGRRFVNEAAPYVTFVHRQLAGGHDPIWFVFDRKAKNRYQFGGVMPGQKFPDDWFTSGLMHRAESLEALASRIGVPPASLRETVDRFNGFARDGQDSDFGRGNSAYDNYYGDPTLPHPTMDVIDSAPLLRGTHSGRRPGHQRRTGLQRARPGVQGRRRAVSRASMPPVTPRPR